MSGAQYPGLAKVQHYVPRCLLKGFTTDSDQLWVFDKQSSRDPFLTSVKNVAAEKDFYNIRVDGGVATLEPFLSRLEDVVAAVLTRVRDTSSLGWLSAEDRMALAIYTVVQHQRTSSSQLRMTDMMEQLSKRMREMGANFGIPEDQLDKQMPGARPATAEETRRLWLSMTAEAAKFAPLVFDKTLILARAPTAKNFMVSDNPVALHNSEDHGWQGNIGLAVRGIQLYLPISSQLMLWWVCPIYEEMFRENLEKVQRMKRAMSKARRAALKSLAAPTQAFILAADDGVPLEFSGENMLHANSMQVRYAERFVFRSTNDFDLARQMLAKNPGLRQGPRGSVG